MKNKPINYRLNENDLTMLPHDEQLEKFVLGLILEMPQLFDRYFKYLNIEGIFYNQQHETVWNALQAIVADKMQPTADNAKGYFKRQGNKPLAVLCKALPIYAGDISQMRQYCLKLFELATRRNIIRVGHDMNQKGLDGDDAMELLANASNGIGHIYERISGMKSKSIADGVDELANELVAIASSPDGMLGLKGSLPLLNYILKGYRKGNMIVVGASSGEGKSTFMLQEVNHMVKQNIPVGIFSLEMTQSELLLKLACEKLNLEIELALSGRLSNEQTNRLGNLLTEMKGWPMQISEVPAMKIGEIKATARMWKSRHKIEMLFIDHMHLINSDFNMGTPEQKFTDIANQIKEVGKELDIPVMALAQLARKDNLSEKRMHVMTDLKYAGGIEQAADVVIMIFRPEHHGIENTADGNSTKGVSVVNVGKLRLLKPGAVKCHFDGLRFSQEGQPQAYTRIQSGTSYRSPLPQEIEDVNF